MLNKAAELGKATYHLNYVLNRTGICWDFAIDLVFTSIE